MKFKLPYGKEYREFDLDSKNLIDVLQMEDLDSIEDLNSYFVTKLENPIASKAFSESIKESKAESAVIIVSDNTRSCPYKVILPVITDNLVRAGISTSNITFVVATGTHPAMSEEDIIEHYGKETADNYRFVCHDCYSEDLVEIGILDTGYPVKINKYVYEADYVITTGILNTHYLAGFSGGRKSILPGVSDYNSIQRNHSQVKHKDVQLANISTNPIHKQMVQAARFAGVDFNINFVLNNKKQVAEVFCGSLEESFAAGTKFIRDHYSVGYSKLADVVITSAGGYPKDKTLYHTQKCLNNVECLLKPGGTIIAVSSCVDGYGSQTMLKVMKAHDTIESVLNIEDKDISIGGHRAVATARLLSKFNIEIISEMTDTDLRDMHFLFSESVEASLAEVVRKYGVDFKAYVVPNGTFFYGVNR